jgi:hypothetical protein
MFAPFGVRFSVALVELAKVSIRKVPLVSFIIEEQSNKTSRCRNFFKFLT